MIIESNSENQFRTSFADIELVGYHGTCSQACKIIEIQGLLPGKVVCNCMHLDLLAVAQALSIDSNSYRDWLKMRSVTFSRDPNVAVTHALRFCGGQGLMNLQSVASVVIANGDVKRTILAKEIIAQIARFRDSQPVVYAVNLSGLGDRLVNEGAIYQFYIDPRKPLPEASEIGPRRLLARLNIHVK